VHHAFALRDPVAHDREDAVAFDPLLADAFDAREGAERRAVGDDHRVQLLLVSTT
jgi:hypothetical protein